MSKVNKKNQIRRNLLLRALLDYGMLSLTDLGLKTGMTIPVVSKIVGELKKEGLVIDVKDKIFNQAGRPPSIVKLNGKEGYVLGVDLGKVNTNFVLINLEQQVVLNIQKKKCYLDNDISILDTIKKEINSLLSKATVKWQSLLGMGFSIPGIVDGPKGNSETYLNFNNGKPLVKTLQEYFKKPVQIEHDVKALALGELWFGEARNTKNALCLMVDWGLGLGIIIDGKIYYGNQSYSGEFGHIQIVPEGDLCFCGKRGCLETVVSGQAITKTISNKINSSADSLLFQKIDRKMDNFDWHMVIESANTGDEFSIEILEDAAKYLGKGIGILINLFNPQKIIIGGSMSKVIPHLFLDIARVNAAKSSLTQLNRNIEFVNSKIDPQASALGVGMLAAKELFEVDHLNPAAFV
jgi:predicted NBD/HSP70 family sugar kinase